jgi:hypothetical protein
MQPAALYVGRPRTNARRDERSNFAAQPLRELEEYIGASTSRADEA